MIMTSFHTRTVALASVVTLGISSSALAEPATASFPGTRAEAPPTRNECLDAHRTAQELRKDGKLLESQEKLLICSSESCPGALITDCGKWLTELEQATPSVVFEVRVDGKDENGARVELDGKTLADWSQAVKVNPGRHEVRVTVDGFEPYVESVLTPEGQRLKMISAEFKKPVAPAAAPELAPKRVELSRPTPPAAYVLLGAAVVGAGGFATFAAMGKTKQNQLDNDCLKVMPCTDADLAPMKKLYLVGDISAGVGAAALIGAAVVYFTRPTVETTSPATFQVGGIGASPASFGLWASRRW